MIVKLSGGFQAEVRDGLTGGDRRAARKAITITVSEDGSREVTAGLEDTVKYALLRRLITTWDVPGLPVPCNAANPDGVLDSLPLEDLEALEAAVQDAYDRIMEIKTPRPRPRPARPVIAGKAEKPGKADA